MSPGGGAERGALSEPHRRFQPPPENGHSLFNSSVLFSHTIPPNNTTAYLLNIRSICISFPCKIAGRRCLMKSSSNFYIKIFGFKSVSWLTAIYWVSVDYKYYVLFLAIILSGAFWYVQPFCRDWVPNKCPSILPYKWKHNIK